MKQILNNTFWYCELIPSNLSVALGQILINKERKRKARASSVNCSRRLSALFTTYLGEYLIVIDGEKANVEFYYHRYHSVPNEECDRLDVWHGG